MKLSKFYTIAMVVLIIINSVFCHRQLFNVIANENQNRQAHKSASLFDTIETDEQSNNNFINFNQLRESKVKTENAEKHRSLFGNQNTNNSNKKNKLQSLFGESNTEARKTNKAVTKAKATKKAAKATVAKVSAKSSKSLFKKVVKNEPVAGAESNAANAAAKRENLYTLQKAKDQPKSQKEQNLPSISSVKVKRNKSKSNESETNHVFLQKEIRSLLSVNAKLIKKISKNNKLSKKRSTEDNDFISFVQKYDKDVKKLEKNLKSSNKIINSEIDKKEKQFSTLSRKNSESFNILHEKIERLERRINSNLNNNKLMRNNVITLNSTTQLKVDDQVYNVGELLEINQFVKKLKTKCGDNLENCSKVSQSDLKEQERREYDILNNLKQLRKRTEEIISEN